MDRNRDNGKPKKQFLKRKPPSYVPLAKAPTKQYKYYADALSKGKESADGEYEAVPAVV